MIRGGFSTQSAWMQFLMLIMLVLMGMLVFTLVGLVLIPVIYDASLSTVMEVIQSGGSLPVEWLIFLQGLSSIGMFLVPAVLAAHLFSLDGTSYLKLNRFPSRGFVVVGLLVLVTLSANSLSDILYRLSRGFVWPEAFGTLEQMINTSEANMSRQIQRFLEMSNTFEFIQVFFVMAILPALCEEVLFRGALQPVFKKMTGNVHLGVFLTALSFALVHLQFYTFLAILALGLILGYIKEWSRSLWPGIIVHLINNGSIVVAVYFFGVDYQAVNEVSYNWDWQYILPGLVILAVSLFTLHKVLHQEKKNPTLSEDGVK